MRISTFFFLLGRGLCNLTRHAGMTFVCILSLTICLVLNGFTWLMEANLNNLVQLLGQQNEVIVYVGVDDEGEVSKAVGDRITAKLGGENTNIEYISKAKVLETYRTSIQGYDSLWDEFEKDNPFKPNFRVRLKEEQLENLSQVVDELSKIEGVVKVVAPRNMANIFFAVKNLLLRIERVLAIVFAVISVVIVGSTIGLSIAGREKEVEVMKYVGASDFVVSFPFFVEGICIGLLSALCSTAIVLLAYRMILENAAYLTEVWQLLLSDPLVRIEGAWRPLLQSLSLLGVLVGGVGTTFSVRKYLKA